MMLPSKVTNPCGGLLALRHELRDLKHGGWGFLYSSTQRITLQDGTPLPTEIQAELNHAAGGALIVSLFALLEDYWPKVEWGNPELVRKEDYQRLLAFRHIRNSVAHKPRGGRADQLTDEVRAFDAVMSSRHPIQGIVECDEMTIKLTQATATDCLPFVSKVTERALGLCLSPAPVQRP